MNKIVVVGPSGAGKSTFSRKLSSKLNISLYHLDNIFWNSDKTHITKEEFDKKLEEILSLDNYIIDGDYSRTYEARFKNSDTIIFLNYPLDLCINGVSERIGKKRLDIPWVEDEFDPLFMQWIKNWFIETKPILLNLLDKYRDTKTIIEFKDRNQANDFINSLYY